MTRGGETNSLTYPKTDSDQHVNQPWIRSGVLNLRTQRCRHDWKLLRGSLAELRTLYKSEIGRWTTELKLLPVWCRHDSNTLERTSSWSQNSLHVWNRSVNNKVKTTSGLVPRRLENFEEDLELTSEHFTFLKSVGKQQSLNYFRLSAATTKNTSKRTSGWSQNT